MTENFFKIKEVNQIYLSNEVYSFLISNEVKLISTRITIVFKGKLNSTKTTY